MNATFLYMARLSIENGNEFMSTRNNCYINPTVQYNCMTSKTIFVRGSSNLISDNAIFGATVLSYCCWISYMVFPVR